MFEVRLNSLYLVSPDAKLPPTCVARAISRYLSESLEASPVRLRKTLFAAGDLCTTGEVVSATEQDFEPTEQDFEPTERRSCHGIGTSMWKFKQRFAGAHPHQVCRSAIGLSGRCPAWRLQT
jgi:hypothetical protein